MTSRADAARPATAPRRRIPLLALYAAQLCSLAGNAIALVAIPIIVLQQTGSPLAAGVAGIFATVPLVVGGALGGVLVDRFGYRASSIAADIASGVTVLAIPLLDAAGLLSFGALLALVFLGGLLDAPGDTAKTVLMPDLAALARIPLARAAGAQSAVQRTATMVGAGVAGALVALAGPMTALVADAAGFAVSALLVALLVPRPAALRGDRVLEPDEAAETAGSSVQAFIAGIRFVWRTPLARGVVLLVTLTNAIDAAGMTVLKPVYASQVLGDPAVLGFMVGCFAAGALTGSALFGIIGHRASGRTMFAICFVLAGAPPYAAMALGAPVEVLFPVLTASGLAAGAINPMIATALYSVVPDGMRARVFGALTAGVAASMPVGALLAGVTVEAFGLGGVLAGAAVLYAVLGASPLLLRSFDGLSSAGRAASVVDRDDEAEAGAAADAPRSAAEAVR
ncbi:putative multidrug-efflux transporter [Agromyces sp. NDB4Y10]|uniref:MFS transporter n=1 Tax=Agromyces sp. NDB4Y10 TaxID=1775951 RepID=UPI0007B2C864|nr:MFS transporter [Agromyces sp. NDB4Y10]KZE92872.1 putative multidrug-efflux transporter [Agromyces sp. NDB4Y10]